MADLFDVLIADGEVGIERLVAERTQESVSLDFKLKSDPENGRFSETDKKVLAKALSAFANSAGGVLVWGIDGRKEKGDTVDCARDAVPITDIEAFKSEANTLLGHLLQPKHDGIKVEAILSAKQPGTGYLAMRVARSERRPHRSEAKDQKQYSKRSGDSSFAMEHYDIEDAFRRVVVPEVEFDWTTERVSPDGNGVEMGHLLLQLVNNSRLTARYPYLHINSLKGAEVVSPQPSGYSAAHHKGWQLRDAQPGKVINPSTRSTVLRLQAGMTFQYGQFIVHGGRLEGPFVRFRVRYGCENALMKKDFLELSVEDLYKADER